ncbi:MAG TPA: hypothetical protein VNE59_05705 [Burkholderiales bacterium]|nr:hypothetical protein [Burkholderiales bacterium]
MTRAADRAFLAAGIALTLGLLWASVVPAARKVFAYGDLHYAAHFAAFAVLAFAWRRGLRGVPAWIVLLAVVAFGFGQEAIEIAGHAHPFELADALVDAAGALVGVVIARTTQRTRAGAPK